jgi:hypothetical protein
MSYVEQWFFYPNGLISYPFSLLRNVRQEAFIEAIYKNPDFEFFLNLSNYLSVKSNNISFLLQEIFDERLLENFISKRINSFHGALRTSILVAIYMGFKECVLVGYDYTHIPNRTLHFYENGHGDFVPQPTYIEDFFSIAKEFIDIKSITLDDKSDFLEGITYEEYTGRKPSFKENTELVHKSYPDMLATWEGYLIY